jgi:hypothetical protein
VLMIIYIREIGALSNAEQIPNLIPWGVFGD